MIGKVPDGWRVEKWENILSIKNGKNQKKVLDKNGIYPIYGSGGNIMGYANDYLCVENSVIVGRKGSINNPIFIKEKFWNVDTAFGLISNKDILNSRYLYYFSLTFDFERLNTTTTIPSLTKERLKNILMPLPPLPQQEKIVKVLDISSALIEKQKELLKKYDLFLKSKFIEMFGDPISNPMGWEVEKWENTLIIQNGKNQKKVIDDKGKFPIYGSGGVMGYANDYLCLENSMIIGRKGSINNPILVKEKFWNVDTAFGIYPNNKKLSIYYLFYFAKKFNFELLNTTTTIPSLTKTRLLQINIPLPPIELQNKFASIVEKTEQIKEKEAQKLHHLETLHKSLMDKAFNGEIA